MNSKVRISIIVPAFNCSNHLYECLFALKASPYPALEIIVVDDASTDDTASVAAQIGARVFKLDSNSGPAAARNYGARHAKGEILFFVDADVVVPPRTVHHIVKSFENHPEISAVFGSYDSLPRAQGIVSQYRNLLHHFVHQHGNPEASTFWAGCGAIRRSAFEEVGGFDEKRFPHPSIEDIELGYRLRKAGYRILLEKHLQGTHLKRWTLGSIIRTDIFCRAIPWTHLMMESTHVLDDLNLKWSQRLSGVLVLLAIFLLPIASVWPKFIALSAGAILCVIFMNRDLYKFFFQQRGFLFALGCIPLHLLYYLYSTLCFLYVWAGLKLKTVTSA